MRRPPKPWLVGLAAVAVAAGGAVAVGVTRQASPLAHFIVAAGGRGGVYYAYGQGLAAAARKAYPGVRAQVLPTAASVENLRLVAAGEADVGFSLADSAALAVYGREPFERPAPLRALAWLYDNYTQLVVRAGSPVRAVANLRGRAVSTGAPGSGTELLATRILTAAGIDPDAGVHRSFLDIGDSVAALRDGRIDAFFFSGGLPTPAITGLAAATAIRLVDLAGFVAGLRASYGDFYAERSIPATTYGLGEEVATIGVANYLVVRGDMPDATAYAITRLLFTAKPELVAAHPAALHLNPRTAVDTFPLRLHPGAERYYRQAKP
jgi:TRAP transporter TAXI family solute receptor